MKTTQSETCREISNSSILDDAELKVMKSIGIDLKKIWNAETTNNVDRKSLLRCLIEEVQLKTNEDHVSIKIVWKGGKASMETLKRLKGGQVNKTSESDIELIRKLAKDFDDAQIARVLSRQGRTTARNNPYSNTSVRSIRGKNKIPACTKKIDKTMEGPFTLDETAVELGVAMSTVQEWLKSGLLNGEQVTAGAPWKIYLNEATRKRLKGGDAPTGWLGLTEASMYLGLTKSMVSYLVKSGKIGAVRVQVGKRMCWKINVKSYTKGHQKELFDQIGNTCI